MRANLPPNPQQWTQVLTLYERAMELDSSSVATLTGLATALIDTTDGRAEDPEAAAKYRRANELITQAELLNPHDMWVMIARVYLLGKQGRYIELIPIAQRAIEAFPNASGFNLWLGTCLMRSGRAAEAIPHLEQDIRLNPRSPYIYTRHELMGYALTFLGRYEEAISWFQRSIAAHPNMAAWLRSQILATMAAARALSGRIEEACIDAGEARRLWPTLTVRSHYRFRTFGSVIATQIAQMRDGLRLAGLRDHADEDDDSGLISDNVLHIDYEGATPTTAPGAKTIRTHDLATFLEEHAPLVLDTSPWGASIPLAIGLWGAGIGGAVLDEYHDRLDRKMQELTGGDRARPVVAMGFNSERYQGRNLALRLVALGYTNVYWYRGGREAWEVAGLPETELVTQDW
jgi:tetratricopeptide (TPR) repeat protein